MKSERRITWLKPLLWINRDSVLRLRQTRLSNNSRIDAIRRQNSLGSLFLERKTRWNIANAENSSHPYYYSARSRIPKVLTGGASWAMR